eukprot:1036945-Rhodomonas_salina.1
MNAHEGVERSGMHERFDDTLEAGVAITLHQTHDDDSNEAGNFAGTVAGLGRLNRIPLSRIMLVEGFGILVRVFVVRRFRVGARRLQNGGTMSTDVRALERVRLEVGGVLPHVGVGTEGGSSLTRLSLVG